MKMNATKLKVEMSELISIKEQTHFVKKEIKINETKDVNGQGCGW